MLTENLWSLCGGYIITFVEQTVMQSMQIFFYISKKPSEMLWNHAEIFWCSSRMMDIHQTLKKEGTRPHSVMPAWWKYTL